MTDRLEALFNRFSVRAHLFHAGVLCGDKALTADDNVGQLHLIKAGTVKVLHQGEGPLVVTQPSLLLYPKPVPRRFIVDNSAGAELVCANLHFDGGESNPIAAALPPFLCVPLSAIDGVASILTQLFEEAFEQRCGRQALVNRLFEVVLIMLLRYVMEAKQVSSGMLAGMGHIKLRKALVAIHEQPNESWTLESMAVLSGMSRSVFASEFRETVGCTPGNYLQAWRIRLAQHALRNGRSIKMIIAEIGYGSEAAFSRAFKGQTGLTPREWRLSIEP